MQQHKLLLGSHMSIAGGLEQAILRAQDLGLNCVQFFSKSNRQWKAKNLTQKEIDLFKKTLKESSIISTTIHASYLINIGSPNDETSDRSRFALADELKRASDLGVDHLVFHPGSRLKSDEEDCLERIAQQINTIFNDLPKTNTKLAIETMAGQGSGVCYTFDQIRSIIDRIEQKDRIGVCLDTCHIFAAGYDLNTDYKKVMYEFDNTIGLDYLSVIHLNDSKKPCGSRVDRHEHLGEGEIQLEVFKQLLTDPRLVLISKILETPKDSPEDDPKNIALIKQLIRRD